MRCYENVASVDEAFIRALGRPDPATPSGLRFAPWLQRTWDRLHPKIGSGWFADGFLYLFGDGVSGLAPCLDAWSFLVPPSDDRVLIGRNAYGAILVLDNASDPARHRVRVLDPWTVTYDGAESVTFASLIARALPQRELADFLDDRPYRDWRKANGVERLGLDDVLGIKVPKPLGGRLDADNLQLDGVVDYYQATGPIYAEALSKGNRS